MGDVLRLAVADQRLQQVVGQRPRGRVDSDRSRVIGHVLPARAADDAGGGIEGVPRCYLCRFGVGGFADQTHCDLVSLEAGEWCGRYA